MISLNFLRSYHWCIFWGWFTHWNRCTTKAKGIFFFLQDEDKSFPLQCTWRCLIYHLYLQFLWCIEISGIENSVLVMSLCVGGWVGAHCETTENFIILNLILHLYIYLRCRFIILLLDKIGKVAIWFLCLQTKIISIFLLFFIESFLIFWLAHNWESCLR